MQFRTELAISKHREIKDFMTAVSCSVVIFDFMRHHCHPHPKTQAGGKDLFFAVLSRPGTASPALGTYEGADMLSSDEDELPPETNPLARPVTAPNILVGE